MLSAVRLSASCCSSQRRSSSEVPDPFLADAAMVTAQLPFRLHDRASVSCGPCLPWNPCPLPKLLQHQTHGSPAGPTWLWGRLLRPALQPLAMSMTWMIKSVRFGPWLVADEANAEALPLHLKRSKGGFGGRRFLIVATKFRSGNVELLCQEVDTILCAQAIDGCPAL